MPFPAGTASSNSPLLPGNNMAGSPQSSTGAFPYQTPNYQDDVSRFIMLQEANCVSSRLLRQQKHKIVLLNAWCWSDKQISSPTPAPIPLPPKCLQKNKIQCYYSYPHRAIGNRVTSWVEPAPNTWAMFTRLVMVAEQTVRSREPSRLQRYKETW